MRVPSGDHAGRSSESPPGVMFTAPLLRTLCTQMSQGPLGPVPRATAIRVRSGAQLAWRYWTVVFCVSWTGVAPGLATNQICEKASLAAGGRPLVNRMVPLGPGTTAGADPGRARASRNAKTTAVRV